MLKCRLCRTPVESMRTTDAGVVFICGKCDRDLAPHELALDRPAEAPAPRPRPARAKVPA